MTRWITTGKASPTLLPLLAMMEQDQGLTPPQGKKVLIVDDPMMEGHLLLKLIEKLRSEGIDPQDVELVPRSKFGENKTEVLMPFDKIQLMSPGSEPTARIIEEDRINAHASILAARYMAGKGKR